MNDSGLEILQKSCSEFFSKTKEEIMSWIDYMFKIYNLEYEYDNDGVVFKVEDTTITDDYGNTQPITDLYFKISWVGEVSARRFSFTKEQYDKQYIHSHIGRSYGLNNFSSSVCFGSVISTSNFTKALTSFLCIHKVFCSTESTKTSPFYYIKDISNIEGKVKVVNSDILCDFKVYLGCVKSVRIRVDDKRLDFSINYDEDKLLSKANIYDWMSYTNGKEYFESMSTNNVAVEKDLIINSNFVFKGKIIPFIVRADSSSKYKKVLCKKTISFFENELKKRLIKKVYERKYKPTTDQQ